MTNSNVLTQYQSEVIEALKSVANLGKPFEKVIIDTLKLFMAIPDKINFLQMGRYGEFTEQTYRNTFTRDVIDCYITRFQLEFCFRNAKSYAGLNDCQARDLRRLEFHFNASFASINLTKAACKYLGVPFSVSSCKSMIHNAYMLERFICVSGLRPNPQVIDKLFKELVLFTSRAA